MELNICHLYPDLLNVYGDIGNILVLKYRAQQRGIKINVSNVSIKDSFPIDKYDIALFGGGQDYEQSIVSKDMVETKKNDLTEYIEKGKVLLAICGGYQLLGKYYTTPEGEKLDGLDILDIYTEGGDIRFIGNTVIKNEEFNETYVGFENHSGRTYIGNLKPLGKVIAGYGNNGEDQEEGCIYKNTFCTYFHGSLLSKNPELADRLLSTALKNKYGEEVELEPLDDNLEFKAKEFIINRESKA
ncbi:type 1 glutamine amidotransferase [Clostridium botulinum]|uniref:Lipid II isoglutaminyl synthase (glutamine-hydrolyzing) subunit GatD n=1 Tax=Clostridium botulinum (strain Langeland / NCTC 10281 / Type F) TaxID=441772 RepID=A7GAH1_CLOBL|nr:type 1 glutamine amidotransferase [Clostridium botulinum]ABS40423.1 glutamine amidotransferase, CobB/CobQ family [Clostridium botulinum F str. Langeland]ADF98247.1 glutamine amidotransferase, CobB/CobQ family [Clostridium botulinum F str. 230613]KKM41400.1 glutamine amidotransferase [Clostridium botulinum]MBY6794437.1 type 1 glutamine amidotransferase [Clostridium botulinum]MBY6938225.1 type 1 glutamine amidotransferase [Clostridium botulinum]